MKEEQVSLEFENVMKEKKDGIDVVGMIIFLFVLIIIAGMLIGFGVVTHRSITNPRDRYDYEVLIDGEIEIIADTYRFEDDGVFMYIPEGGDTYHYIKDYKEIIIRPIKLNE